MMNDRTFPIPSNTISVKSEDYTNKSLQMDSNPATMEVSGASCRSVRAKFSAYSRVIRKAGCASHAQKRSLHIAKYRNEQKSARFHIVTCII